LLLKIVAKKSLYFEFLGEKRESNPGRYGCSPFTEIFLQPEIVSQILQISIWNY